MRKRNIQLLFIVFISITCTISSFAQNEDTSDFASWNAVGIGYKVNDKLNFGLEQHLRFKDNIHHHNN